MPKVWVTRTRPGAEKTAKALRARGFDPIISPLLEVAPADNIPPMPDRDAMLVFTSGNGVRAFCDLTDRRAWPVITVGDATADLARHCGFEEVRSASGDSADLLNLIKDTLPKTQPIVHGSGEIVRGNIVERLQAFGYKARRNIYYNTVPTNTFPAVSMSAIDIVLLHSPLAAKALSEQKLDLSKTIVISLSQAVDEALTAPAIGERRVANSPDEAALLACLPR